MIKNTSFLDQNEIAEIGFKSVGKNVFISRKASFYSPEKMIIGDQVRIDDFVILSGTITLGSYIHISAYSACYGSEGIEMQDFSGLSPRVTVFSATDDFSGKYMVGPMLPAECTNIISGKIIIEKFVQVGTGSVILPKITLGEGSAVGALSLVTNNSEPWKIVAGVPAKIIKSRSENLKNIHRTFKQQFNCL